MASNGIPKLERGALQGVKVVDVTQFGAGPICTQLLGDMGAEVVKVEPLTGEPARKSVPVSGDRGGYFPAFNRNKKSVTLDLRSRRGKEVFTRLVRWGDVLVENFRPGVMDRLGFDYQTVRAVNPAMIVVSISGFGRTGPYARRAAMDYVVQAMSGVMSLTGQPTSPPTLAGTIIADFSGALSATIGAVSALYARKETGQGQYVEISLLETLLISMADNISYFARGEVRERGVLPVCPAGAYLTRDNVYIVIMGHNDAHFPYIARLWGRPDLAESPEYSSRDGRHRHHDEMNRLMAEWVAGLSIDEVERLLDEGGVPYGRILDTGQILEDPHLRARGSIQYVEHDGEGALPLLAPHPIFHSTPSTIRAVAPHLGEHNAEIYGMLGYSLDEIEQMKKERVI